MTVPHSTDAVALTIFVVLFAAVAIIGFVAARWRRGDLSLIDEWGLGGRRFGSVVTWFLLGGDLYTAYTFIAVPALVFGVGAAGFFAVPYTVIVFPIVFVFALAVAVTGILATMPYIALQLVGIQAVLTVMGVGTSSSGFVKDLPLILA